MQMLEAYLVPQPPKQTSAATGAADATITLATAGISGSRGIMVVVSNATFLSFDGDATTANDIFPAGSHFIPFRVVSVIHKQGAGGSGTVTIIGMAV